MDCSKLKTIKPLDELLPEEKNENGDPIVAIFGDGMNSIPAGMFGGCLGLEYVSIPNTVRTVETSAFEACSNLKKVKIPSSVKTIGSRAFIKASSLETITMKGVQRINEEAFRECTALETVDFADNALTFLGKLAFGYCTALTIVNIPSSLSECESGYYLVTEPWYGPFTGCSKLKTIKPVGDLLPEEKDENGKPKVATFGATLSALPNYLFVNCNGLENVIIPQTVKTVGVRVFSACLNLTEITIPGSVETIEYNAFLGATSLKKVVIEEGAKKIEKYAFQDCTALESVRLADTVTYLGACAFRNCTSLTIVNIPSGLRECGHETLGGPFAGCSKLKMIKPFGELLPEEIDENGKAKVATFGGKLPYIPSYLFYNCTGLESVIIPHNVNSVGNSTFSGCTNLKELTIPGNVKIIGQYAFAGDTSIRKVLFEDGVEDIEKYAFQNCTALESVKLADTITYMICRAKAPDFARSSYRQGDFTLKSGITNPITA